MSEPIQRAAGEAGKRGNFFLNDAPLSFRINAKLRQSAPARWMYRARRREEADYWMLSFPKAGRTWLRMLLGKALADHFELNDADLMELHRMRQLNAAVPRIRIKHDDNPHLKTPDELVRNKSEYRDVKVVLLVRGIHDLAVSNYFQATKRDQFFSGDISAFVHNRRGGAESMVEFHNIWAANKDVPRDFLLLRYEDMKRDVVAEMTRLWKFMGLAAPKAGLFEAAKEFCSFENMRKMESGDAAGSGRLRAADPKDKESFKTRKGVVGGYVDYLSAADIAWLDELVATRLSPIFGYGPRTRTQPTEQ